MKLESRGKINEGEEYPIQYAYFMEEKRTLSPKYNVGTKWGEIIEKQVETSLKVRSNAA